MADFEVFIDEHEFAKRDVKVSFDEDTYTELLDEYAPNASGIVINVAPHITFRRNKAAAGLAKWHFRKAMTGKYDDNEIWVYGQDDVKMTNDTLLHESKHLIDDAAPEYGEAHQDYIRRFKILSLSCGVTGTAAGVVANAIGLNPIESTAVGVLVGGVPFNVINRIWYYSDAFEGAARQFAVDPIVQAKYGRIISYS